VIETIGQDRPKIVIAKEQLVNRQGKDFVLYAGLLDAAHRNGLSRITTTMVESPRAENKWTAIVSARVQVPWGIYDGLGDANAENVGRMIAPHIVRMAETRAKARALRDALNVGMAAVEELVSLPSDRDTDVDEDGPLPLSPPSRPSSSGAAPRRVNAQVTRPPAQNRGPDYAQNGGSSPPMGSEDDERAKYTRLAGTAKRLGLDGVVDLAADAPLDFIVETRNALLKRVNEKLAAARQGTAGSAG